ncbi:MAG: hypothetical protein ACLQVX_25065 [Limisphaerales bacterium]
MSFKHHDEARTDAVMALMGWLRNSPDSRAVFIDDLYGKCRLILWPGRVTSDEMVDTLKGIVAEAAGSYWSGQAWVVTARTSTLDRQVYEGAWEEGRAHPEEPRLRIVDRVRNRLAWFGELADPPWEARGGAERKGPPIVVFYSFKGGVGRTTALASFAIQRARAGERVAVIDGDLDAPGIGPFFAVEEPGLRDSQPAPGENMTSVEGGGETDKGQSRAAAGGGARWGVVDYLLEGPSAGNAELSDYYHSVRNEPLIPGNGEILVFAAGLIDENYLAKLARLDFDPARKGSITPWGRLLQRIRQELSPDWILMDSRAGLDEPAGLLLGGLAHLHVLLGTSSEQSWQGIRLILDRIGSGRVLRGKPQADCVLVQAMIPEFHDAAVDAQAAFLARAENEFEAHYYAEDPEDPEDDSMWFIRDMPGKDAPHQPVCLSYKQNLAHFRRLENVAPELLGEQYRRLAERIASRFVEEPE